MTNYDYPDTPAIDPLTGNVPYGSSGQLFATSDTTHTSPLTATDLTTGSSISTFTVSQLGYVKKFRLANYPACIWWDGTYAILLEATGGRIPNGGNPGQVLSKASFTDGDTEWIDPVSGGGTLTVAPVDKVRQDETTGVIPPRPTTDPNVLVFWDCWTEPTPVTSGTGGAYPRDLWIRRDAP
jgi:hypothetical protein